MPNALLERPATRAHLAHRDGDTPLPPMRRVCERTANRFAQLLRSPESLPAFQPVSLKQSECPEAFAAALACPDAFLLNAPGGPARIDSVCALASEARTAGQRLLVLARGSEEAATLARRFHDRGNSTVLCSTSEGLPSDALALTERRKAERERAEECRRLEAQVNRAAEELERLEKAQRAFQDYKQHEEALRNELAELGHAAASPPGGLGGFVKKLFGSSKPPADLPKRIAALEEQLQNLAAPANVEPAAIEQAAAAHRAADAAFAWAIAKPLELAPETVAGLEIVVATYDALQVSRLLSEEGPHFDRLLVMNGEELDEVDFLVAAARAEAWVLFGNPEADGYFTYLWMHLHKPGPWLVELNRLVYRLDEVEHDRTEPLADRPEIELRFAEDALAAIAFPASIPLPEAKEFVARELGDLAVESASSNEPVSRRTAQL